MVYRETNVAPKTLSVLGCTFVCVYFRVFAIVLSKLNPSGIPVVRVTIAMRENTDGTGPSRCQLNSTTKHCKLTYLCGGISLTTFVSHQMAD